MYASIDFATKNELRQAIKAGAHVIAYSPLLGSPVLNWRITLTGPWPLTKTAETSADATHRNRRIPEWHARVVVRDMRIVDVVH